MKRKRYAMPVPRTGNDGYGTYVYDYYDPAEVGALLSSEIEGSKLHLPVLDVDDTSVVVPSTTPGHFHILAPKPLSWRKYKKLLYLCAEAGIVDREWSSKAIRAKKGRVHQPVLDAEALMMGETVGEVRL